MDPNSLAQKLSFPPPNLENQKRNHANSEISLRIHPDRGELVSSLTRRYLVQRSEMASELPARSV